MISSLFFEEADKCVRGGLEFLCELGGLRCGLGELVSSMLMLRYRERRLVSLLNSNENLYD